MADTGKEDKFYGTAELANGPNLPPHPLFPPLPSYDERGSLRKGHGTIFRVSSAICSFVFLIVLIFAAIISGLGKAIANSLNLMLGKSARKGRPSLREEQSRRYKRRQEEAQWREQAALKFTVTGRGSIDRCDVEKNQKSSYTPTEGGKDQLPCDIRYYARRVGLDARKYEVTTQDGFILSLWRIIDPRDDSTQQSTGIDSDLPELDSMAPQISSHTRDQPSLFGKKYPVLLIHGLLQSSGAYCVNDDDSLAFYLAKAGYDVWLGDNRCGFEPKHKYFSTMDPRMWNWNIQHMGNFDLPAFVEHILRDTNSPKLALVCHSQGTAETFVALAKSQRAELGEKLSVVCALAPTVYAGPLLGKVYFRFIQILSARLFRIFFGIHAFVPFMITVHKIIPKRLYGILGYYVFSFLFGWTDQRWDRGLRNRFFQFSSVYISAESMRWWLGRGCFAFHKCILSTREESQAEEDEDGNEYAQMDPAEFVASISSSENDNAKDKSNHFHTASSSHTSVLSNRVQKSWYDERVPPFALWIAGADELVDGRRLLRRFASGREPHVRVAHAKIIPEYEHLDVLWAMDAVEQVAKEVKSVIWDTVPVNMKAHCILPAGLLSDERGQVPRNGAT